MRLALALLLLTLAAPPLAAAPPPTDPLVSVEVRAGLGVETGGASGATSVRRSPILVSARAAFAINAEPATASYVGVLAETGDRASVGAVAGMLLMPHRPNVRVAAGVMWLMRPYSLWGATASVGRCLTPSRGFRVCGDAEALFLVGGSDLPSGHTAIEWQFVLGVGFDAM
ncbi:MAG: hypothetical protein K8W52_08670 [Deltaproteobacteria bacterium]|nr:hypothetical protein [Deltaproteobacteria bacterium]